MEVLTMTVARRLCATCLRAFPLCLPLFATPTGQDPISMHPIRSALLLVLVMLGRPAAGQTADGSVDELVPQTLLGLLHAPQVQKELGLTGARLEALESFFQQIDGPWFRSRNQPPAEGRKVVRQLERRAWDWLTSRLPTAKLQRLRQIELRSQGVRSLLREDVARAVNLDADQRRELLELARATESARAALAAAIRSGTSIESARDAAEKAQQEEQGAFQRILRPNQLQALSDRIGPPFDTSTLTRVYPMAPELPQTDQWINSPPLTLNSLRGKVVLVHFYAFQCHNCHANFPHYKRWHEKYPGDVVVIGIQTPETSAERDPQRVRLAAEEEGLEFPILIDIDRQAWNGWSNTMWPTIYVIDKRGYLRMWWQGELNWEGATGDQTIERLIDRLREES
ncbi:MAG: hypothetical protein D6753_11055 [Planctomycetota bacterium]|nr:MAG: hypothetical protein D6753_11055 [Planctomycetota bacterium]